MKFECNSYHNNSICTEHRTRCTLSDKLDLKLTMMIIKTHNNTLTNIIYNIIETIMYSKWINLFLVYIRLVPCYSYWTSLYSWSLHLSWCLLLLKVPLKFVSSPANSWVSTPSRQNKLSNAKFQKQKLPDTYVKP